MSVPDSAKIVEVRQYHKNAIESYSSIVRMTENFFKKPLNEVDETELRRDFYHMVHPKNRSSNFELYASNFYLRNGILVFDPVAFLW